MLKRSYIYLGIVLIIVVAVVLNWHYQQPIASTIKKIQTKKAASSQGSPSPNQAEAYPNDVASSIWAVVNKGRQLPASYVPSGLVNPAIPLAQAASTENMHLRGDAAAALAVMAAAAKQDGASLMLGSGYRSYRVQVSTYNAEVASYGQAKADTESARPGHSEHQTGLAADLEPASGQCAITDCFASTVEGKWLAHNSYKYGFIIRYQENNQNLTGYRYEPWHVRYVGNDLAQKLHNSNQTLEQYFGLAAYTDYPARSEILKL